MHGFVWKNSTILLRGTTGRNAGKNSNALTTYRYFNVNLTIKKRLIHNFIIGFCHILIRSNSKHFNEAGFNR